MRSSNDAYSAGLGTSIADLQPQSLGRFGPFLSDWMLGGVDAPSWLKVRLGYLRSSTILILSLIYRLGPDVF
jgi:hypothetical protein